MTPHSHDGPSRQALREHWQVSPECNPGFRTAVWARLEAARNAPATWGAWLRLNFFRVSSFAVLAIALAGVGGGALARTQASQQREELVQRYLASIDPHQRAYATHR
jgi:hypothetical protein